MAKAKKCPCGRLLGSHAKKHNHVWYCFECSLRYEKRKPDYSKMFDVPIIKEKT